MVEDLIKREFSTLRNPLYRNSIYISLASMTTALASFLFWILAARLYPAEDVGVASAVVSAINLTFQLSMLGMNFALIRFYPEYGGRATGSAFVLTAMAALFFSMIYGIIMMHSGSFEGVFSSKFLGVFVGFSVIGTVYNVLSTYAIAKRKAEHSFAQSLLFAGRFLFLFFLVSLGVLGIVLAFGLGLILGLMYALVFIDDVSLKIDHGFLKDAFRFSLGNYVANIANLAPTYLMPSIVLEMLGKENTAYFYMAFAVGNMLFFVPSAINMSFFVEGSHGKIVVAVLKKVLFLSYVYQIVVLSGIWAFGEIILKLFGSEYTAGVGLLKIFILAGFLMIPYNLFITLLNLKKRARDVAILNSFKAVLFLVLSYLLIPEFGIEGVGWGWFGAYVLVLGMIGVLIFKHHDNIV